MGRAPWMKRPYNQSPGIALHEEIVDLVAYLSPTAAEARMREGVVARITEVVHQLWPKAVVEVLGSYRNGVYLPTSDIDLVVTGRWPTLPLRTLANALQREGIPSKMTVIAKARVGRGSGAPRRSKGTPADVYVLRPPVCGSLCGARANGSSHLMLRGAGADHQVSRQGHQRRRRHQLQPTRRSKGGEVHLRLLQGVPSLATASLCAQAFSRAGMTGLAMRACGRVDDVTLCCRRLAIGHLFTFVAPAFSRTA